MFSFSRFPGIEEVAGSKQAPSTTLFTNGSGAFRMISISRDSEAIVILSNKLRISSFFFRFFPLRNTFSMLSGNGTSGLVDWFGSGVTLIGMNGGTHSVPSTARLSGYREGLVMSIGLSLLLASACGYGFEVLDTTDEEWVAPGYEVVEEAVIDPLEYGEPYTCNGTPTVGVHLSFVETGTGEVWRVVFVLDRKVVVLQEGEEPDEIPVDLDIASCAFSPSGRYVVVHDEVREVTDRNAERIDLETGDVRLFDSHPSALVGAREPAIANDGTVHIGTRLFDPVSLTISAEADDIPGRLGWPVMSPQGNYLAIGSNYGSRVYLMNREDGIVWERETGSTIAWHMVFSPDERFLAIPLQTGLEVWDVATGETVWRDESGQQGSAPVFDPDGTVMWYRGAGYRLPADLETGQPATVVSGYDGDYRFWREIAVSADRVLLEMESSEPRLRRRAVVESGSHDLVWASCASDIQHPGPFQESGRTFRYDVSGIRFIISRSGAYLGLAPGETVVLSRIRSLP